MCIFIIVSYRLTEKIKDEHFNEEKKKETRENKPKQVNKENMAKMPVSSEEGLKQVQMKSRFHMEN